MTNNSTYEKLPNVLAIHDISCVGRCSTTVVLPIISAYGVECRLLPTALLSTHTAGFAGFTYLDLSDEMQKIMQAWQPLDLKFNAIYSGFMVNAAQIDILKSVIQTYPTKTIVDPVMADNGELYSVFDQAYVEKMKEMIPLADVLTPNITEACLLTDTTYQEEQSQDLVEKLAKDLQALGAKSVVITGITIEEGKIGALTLTEQGEIKYALSERQPDFYHGTGDMFGSVLSANLVKGSSLLASAQTATDFIVEAIKATPADADKKYGVYFEKVLEQKLL